MKRCILFILFFPLISFGQQCDTIYPSQYADTIIYCVTDATCHDICDGSITISVIGSNQPYSFSWDNVSAFVAGDNFRDSLCANQYIISIIDGNGNLVNNTYVNDLFSPPNFTLFVNSIKDPSCFNYTDGEIYLSIGGAAPPYAYIWDDGTNTDDRDNLDTGLYILTTTDINDCSRTDTFELINPVEVTSITITDTLSCIGLCDGSGIVTPSDGVAPYTFLWDDPLAQDSSTATGLCYGLNTVYITDVNGCLDTNEVFIANPDTLQLSNTTIDSACYQICDGQLSVTIEGGQSPYTTEWSFGGNIFNTTDTITSDTLCPGDYQLIFTDANNCSDTVVIPLIERDSFLVQDWIINDSCYNSCTGQITVQLLNQQNPPFSYDWSNGGNDTVISNLCSDTLSLEIIDARLCRDTFEFFVAPADSMYFDSIAVVHNSCYGDTDGSITVINFNGGVPPLIYTWSDGQITAAAGINTLPSGMYSVNIEDAFGCSLDSANIEVKQPDSLFATPSALVNVSCFGASDGIIDIDIFGGSGTYFISWDISIPDTNYLDSLLSGEYIYTIVDDSLCTITDTLVIQEPDALAISDSLVHVLCKGDSTGEIHLTISGGTPPYEYSIDNGVTYQSQNYFDNLSAGAYSIIVKDENDCLLNSPVYNISEPLSKVTAGLTAPNLLCYGNTVTIILNVNGGTPFSGPNPYTYSWSNGTTNQNLNSASAGSYSVTILDANGCDTTVSITVTSPPLLTSSFIGNDLLCFQDNSGTIDLTVGGGISSLYTYVWTGPGSYTNTIADPQNLAAGTYNVEVTDANGCIKTETITLTEPDLLAVSSAQTHVDCFGNSTGEIDITVNGGTSPFDYAWSNLATSEDLLNLPAGNYDVTITDVNNCNVPASITINEPSDIIDTVTTTNLICNNESEGEILITASGGTPGYSFSIDGGTSYQNGSNFTNLQAANYSVYIKDQNGCEKNQLVVLNQPIGFSTVVNIQNIDGCNGDLTGFIDFTLNGNTPPYTFAWSNNESTASIYNLSAGNYGLTVSDANNCEMNYSYVVNEPEAMVLVYDIQLASCEEKDDGAITTIVTGGTLPISYQWGTGESSTSIFNLSKGTYSLYVEDSKGCSLPTEIIEVGFDGFNGCIEIPTGFTPNNDNIHDEWVIYGLIDFPDVVVKVYNRWGQEVFSSSGYTKPWDGKYNGVDLPTAAYYYVIELNESDKVFNGIVTIKR